MNSTESGSRFDAMAASVCQAASNMGIRAIWLRSAELRHMELTSDGWHFRSSTREHLQIILQAVFPNVPLPTAYPTGCMASLLESCVDPLDMWRNGDIVEVPTAVVAPAMCAGNLVADPPVLLVEYIIRYWDFRHYTRGPF